MALFSRAVPAWTFVFLAAAPSLAQRWGFQSYGPDQGLTNLAVVGMMQDQQGFIWASTIGGVFRYDGDRFEKVPFRPPGPAVNTLHVSADGQIWAGATAGLFRWTGTIFEMIPGTEKWAFRLSGSLTSDGTTLYSATADMIRGLRLGAKDASGSWLVSSRPSWSLAVTSSGTLWYSCGPDLCSHGRAGDRVWGARQGLGPGRWHGIVEDRHGAVWVRSQSGQVAKLEKQVCSPAMTRFCS